MKVTNQIIPSQLKELYDAVAGTSEWMPDDFKVRKRLPFRIRQLQGCRTIRPAITRGSEITDPMCEHRHVFGECVKCFNKQPYSGGVTPPTLGPRNRSWWWAQAADPYPWCPDTGKELSWDGLAQDRTQRPGLDYVYRDTHYYIKTTESDFLDFYDDMKGLYGYPWSETNDPDEIAYKMWEIITNEVEYSGETYAYFALTSGETAKKGIGDCEDESILYCALMVKALTEIGKSTAWINAHVSVIYKKGHGQDHAFCWWVDKNGTTRRLECTLWPGQLPETIYGAPTWIYDEVEVLYARVDAGGEYDPFEQESPGNCGLWYYNYFMKLTLNAYVGGVAPVWCREPIIKATFVNEAQPDENYDDRDWLAAGWDAGIINWTLIKKPAAATTWKLRVVCYDVLPGIGEYPVVINVHNCSGDWAAETVTWNTRPTPGSIIKTFELYSDDVGWHEIDCGSAPAVMFTREPGIVGYARYRSDAYYLNTVRPWWEE